MKKSHCPLTQEEAQALARLVKLLADPTRLRILSLLSQHAGKLCVEEIVGYFDLEQSTISYHLRLLREAGLVAYDKKDWYAYYYIRQEMMQRAKDMINTLLLEYSA